MSSTFFNRKTVVHGGAVIPHPFGISLFEHNVYFTDWTKMAVMKANKFTDSSSQVVYSTPQTPHGVAVIHQFKQPQGKTLSEAHLSCPMWFYKCAEMVTVFARGIPSYSIMLIFPYFSAILVFVKVEL